MYIIEDTRQKEDKHKIKNNWWAENGVGVTRCRLPFGDYCLPPALSIDTKADMNEIVSNMCGSTQEHVRFREECKAAQAHGCKLIFLIENEEGITCIDDVFKWQNPRRFVSGKAVDGTRLAKTMLTMQGRYGCEFMFCHPNDSARIIADLLQKGVRYEQDD